MIDNLEEQIEKIRKSLDDLLAEKHRREEAAREFAPVIFNHTRAYFDKSRQQWRAVAKCRNTHIQYCETKQEAIAVAKKYSDFGDLVLSAK